MLVHLIYVVEWFCLKFKMVKIAFGDEFENDFEVEEKQIRE